MIWVTSRLELSAELPDEVREGGLVRVWAQAAVHLPALRVLPVQIQALYRNTVNGVPTTKDSNNYRDSVRRFFASGFYMNHLPSRP